MVLWNPFAGLVEASKDVRREPISASSLSGKHDSFCRA